MMINIHFFFQELDFIKDDKNNTRSLSLRLKARKAVDFLNKHFSAKHPRILGQTPTDVEKNKEKFEVECPDDEILQTCLQIKELSKTPVSKADFSLNIKMLLKSLFLHYRSSYHMIKISVIKR